MYILGRFASLRALCSFLFSLTFTYFFTFHRLLHPTILPGMVTAPAADFLAVINELLPLIFQFPIVYFSLHVLLPVLQQHL